MILGYAFRQMEVADNLETCFWTTQLNTVTPTQLTSAAINSLSFSRGDLCRSTISTQPTNGFMSDFSFVDRRQNVDIRILFFFWHI